MSFIPTEKIHLSKKQVLPVNLQENNNNHSNLSANFNRNYSSPFKKIPNNYFTHYSPNLKMINPSLNPNEKTLFVYPPRQYIPFYDRNINLYQKNYYYMNNNRNINSNNIQNKTNENNINDINNKGLEKDLIKTNSNENEKINMNINMNVSNNVYHFCLGENKNNNIQIYSSEKYQEEKKKKKFFCRCKKSNCLKLYCDCFANGEKCIGCNCVNCSNVIGNEINIQKVYDEVVGKNPVSMKLNLKKELRTNGCNCSKSNCLKKYCECYKAGLKCSKICRCKICENMENKEENEINLNEDENELNNEEGKENKNNFIDNDKIKSDNKPEVINDSDFNNNENIEYKKYDYEKFVLEKISVFIKDEKLNIQKYNILKDLKMKDELDNNKIIFSNKTNIINNCNNMSYLQKKTNRTKEKNEN